MHYFKKKKVVDTFIKNNLHYCVMMTLYIKNTRVFWNFSFKNSLLLAILLLRVLGNLLSNLINSQHY